MKRIISLLFLAALTGCYSADEATRALASVGYTDIYIQGYRYFGCDAKEGWHTGFAATGVNGQRVSGVVCSGVLKGATIRLD